MFNRIILLGFLGLLSLALHAQPKLVVGLVVDQMTNEYISRFWDDYEEGGLKRLVNKGVYMPNTFYNYMPTATGPGHASIYTGTTPSMHGIAGNLWFDRESREQIYCVQDEQMLAVPNSEKEGDCSPVNLKGNTMTDMLKLNTGGKSKVVSIAIKDRSAILPGGHGADLALWWNAKTGKWISSTYYCSALPSWVEEFEQTHNVFNYLTTWNPLKNWPELETHNDFEYGIGEKNQVEFPYEMKDLAEVNGFSVLKVSPFGNTYTFDLAKAAIKGAEMGADEIPDFLAISLSSTDYVGHAFGPYSKEIHDVYVRLDQDIKNFLQYLDDNVSEDYVVFLTSDHGVMPNASYMNSLKLGAKESPEKSAQRQVSDFLQKEFKIDSAILAMDEGQIYLDEARLGKAGLKIDHVERSLVQFLYSLKEVKVALSSKDMLFKEYNHFPQAFLQNGFCPSRSGNVLFQLDPLLFSKNEKGAGHGSVYTYDTNVPLIWYGKDIAENVRHHQQVAITQIAPTLSNILGIGRPPFCTSESLMDVIQR